MRYRTIIYVFILLLLNLSAQAQPETHKSASELRLMIRESKPDTTRILLLFELGRSYLKALFDDRKDKMMDTAIMVFEEAIRFSDSLHVKSFRYESMLLQGEAYLEKSNKTEGKKRFYSVASIYRAQKDIEREARTWLRLARNLGKIQADYAETMSYFEKSVALYHSVDNTEKEAAARTDMADYFFKQRQFDNAEKELLYALNLATKNGHRKLYDIYFLLSVVNRYKANFDKSLLYATKCIDNAHELNATALDTFYGELALVYEELGRPEESSVWYRRALDRRKQYKTDRLYIFRTAGFLIRQLIRQNKAGQGLALIDSLTKDYPPQTVLEKATVAQNRAYCFDALKQYTKAEEHFQEMMVNYEKTAYRDEFICIANMDMGKFYLKRQQYNKAQTYLSAALSVAYANPLSDRGEIYQLLFTADSATGNYRAAIEDLQQYKIVNDSVFNDKNTKQIKELEIQYETHKKEQNILLLEKESRLQQTRLNQASITRNWMLAGAALMMIIIILLVSYLGLKQRTTRKLRLQQKEIEKKNTALENLVKEKEWLVKEIHHRVKNNFHIVQVLLGTQSGYLKSEESINALADSQHRVQAMALIHQKLYQSENLSAIRMSAYIHELVDYLKESFNIRQEIQFRLQIDPIELGLSHVIPLGLILNEAITNSIKYAFPDNKEAIITISLQRSFNNHCILTISDNGIGLPARLDIANPVSMGMRLMQGLTEDLEGNFQVINRGGTVIRIDFVYDEESANGITHQPTEMKDTV